MLLTSIWLLFKCLVTFLMVLFRKKIKTIDKSYIFPVCMMSQIIRINNQKREITSAFTLQHFLSLHLLSVTAGFNSSSALTEKS